MALVKWSYIKYATDLQAYIAAEMAQAQSQCPAAYPQYAAANVYLIDMIGQGAGDSAVAATKAMIDAARTTYNASCPAEAAATTAQVEASAVPDSEAGGGSSGGGGGLPLMSIGGMPTWLLLLAAGAGLFLLMKKGKGGAKGKASKAKKGRRSRKAYLATRRSRGRR